MVARGGRWERLAGEAEVAFAGRGELLRLDIVEEVDVVMQSLSSELFGSIDG